MSTQFKQHQSANNMIAVPTMIGHCSFIFVSFKLLSLTHNVQYNLQFLKVKFH
jgi:hypothetical protein